MTYTEYMKENPDAVITDGKSLDHDMEHDERTGWETCRECYQDEQDLDDVCPESPMATFMNSEWDDYVEVSPGVPSWWSEILTAGGINP